MTAREVATDGAPATTAGPGRVAFYTLGCKVNSYDTEAVASLFVRSGYQVVSFDEDAEVYVINTCSVTNMGARKSRQVIRRAIKRNPSAVVVAMGCYAQYAPDEVAAIPGADVGVGTHRRGEIVDLVEEVRRTKRPVRAVVDKIFKVREIEELPVFSFEGRTRAVLKIQDGCNEFCSFCQIPWARGRNRSRRPENVVEQVRLLAEAGYKEIVLTGVHLGTYGVDLEGEMNLARILRMIHDTPGIERIRLSSVDPHEVTAELIEPVADLPKICRHLQNPAQAGNDDVLLLMSRRNSVAEFHEVVQRVRRVMPEVAITTDIIVGFPGETESHFENTVRFCAEIGFSRIHVFPYSVRKGTLAEKLPGHVPDEVKQERTERLISLGRKLSYNYNARLVGREVTVLAEEGQPEHGKLEGLTDTYVRVVFAGKPELCGRFVRVAVERATADGVSGHLAPSEAP